MTRRAPASIRQVGSSPADLSGRSGDARVGRAVPALALLAVAAASAATAVARGLAAAGLVLFGGCALVALGLAAAWRAASLRSADAAAELLDIVDEIGAVVCLRDAEGRYLLVNRQFEQVYLVRRDQALGRRHHDLFPGQRTVAENDCKALAQGTPLQTQDTVEHVDGEHTYFTVRHLVSDRAGRIYAVCAISTDITDLMRAEDDVRRLITDLEQRVRERTADLEASTREIDAFTYSVSHDLRAPLRALAGFSEILLEEHAGQLDPDGRDLLGRVHAAAVRMAVTVDALLDLSHIGRSELQRHPVDLGDLARESLADLRAAEPGREVEAEIDRLPAVGDPRLLSLVMQNLVSNAWKFTGERERGRIGVGRRAYRGAPAYYVEDNGTGFDMKYVDKLFAPFQRLHGTARYPGTGIGLTIVERVVSRHGGRVWAEGEVGSGATFYFTLGPDAEPGGDGGNGGDGDDGDGGNEPGGDGGDGDDGGADGIGDDAAHGEPET